MVQKAFCERDPIFHIWVFLEKHLPGLSELHCFHFGVLESVRIALLFDTLHLANPVFCFERVGWPLEVHFEGKFEGLLEFPQRESLGEVALAAGLFTAVEFGKAIDQLATRGLDFLLENMFSEYKFPPYFQFFLK